MGCNVELRFHLLRTSNYGTNAFVGTLPEQFRPHDVVEASATSLTAGSAINAATVTVNPDGSIYVSAAVADARWLICNVSYLL